MQTLEQLQDEVRQLKAEKRVLNDQIEESARNITKTIKDMEATRQTIQQLIVQAS